MDNFDLKKYLTEGKLLKEEIMVDTAVMMGGDEYLKPMFAAPEEYGVGQEESEAIKDIIATPKMPASKFLEAFKGYWSKFVGEGGDAERIEQGLESHVEKRMLSPEEASEVMIMFGDGMYDSEEKEDILFYFRDLIESKPLK